MKDVLIFGRGKLYQAKKKAIFSMYNVVGFLDNAVLDVEVDQENGFNIYPPNMIKQLGTYDVLIVSTYLLEMWKQLINLNVSSDRIEFGLFLDNRTTQIEQDMYEFDAKLTSLENGISYESSLLGINRTFSNEEQYKSLLREIFKKKHDEILRIRSLPTIPVSRIQGLERGTPIDRYYIEKFLSENKRYICGNCLEVADDFYTRKFGEGKVKQSLVSHVKGWGENAVKVNFETGEGVEEASVDCLIVTQVMQYIFDVTSAVSNIYKVLKPGGVALITLPGIKSLSLYDDENWGEKWSFTTKSAKYLCERMGPDISYEIKAYGNVKTAVAYLYGLCVEELDEKDFKQDDSQYPFLITVRIQK